MAMLDVVEHDQSERSSLNSFGPNIPWAPPNGGSRRNVHICGISSVERERCEPAIEGRRRFPRLLLKPCVSFRQTSTAVTLSTNQRPAVTT
eukprot:scaffold112238_cov28-Tisochrysis_lutea.AAC.3